MSGSILARLILKDLYLTRWLVAASTISGAAAVAIMPFGPTLAYVGGVSLICTLVILNIVVVMTTVVQERKDKVLLFVLSLPVSTTGQTLAKALAAAIAFVGPWLLLTGATAVVIDVSAMPNGSLPFLLTVLVYLLAYHWVLLGVALATDSTGWPATVITVGNISVNFLIPYLLGRPSIVAHRTGPTAIWTADILAFIAVELVVGLVALGVALAWQMRRQDAI
jgi:ABC-type multidrug transport system permease subunit